MKYRHVDSRILARSSSSERTAGRTLDISFTDGAEVSPPEVKVERRGRKPNPKPPQIPPQPPAAPEKHFDLMSTEELERLNQIAEQNAFEVN